MKHQPRHTVTPTIGQECRNNSSPIEFEYHKIEGVVAHRFYNLLYTSLRLFVKNGIRLVEKLFYTFGRIRFHHMLTRHPQQAPDNLVVNRY